MADIYNMESGKGEHGLAANVIEERTGRTVALNLMPGEARLLVKSLNQEHDALAAERDALRAYAEDLGALAWRMVARIDDVAFDQAMHDLRARHPAAVRAFIDAGL